jgi:uncharacterized protein
MTDASTQLERNKALVLDFLDALYKGPEERLVSYLDPDCVFFVLGGSWASGYGDQERWLVGWRIATVTMHVDVTVNIGAITAEDDRVAVEAESQYSSPSGEPTTVQYHFLFRIRDGRISAFKEYFDTQGAFTAFDVAPAPPGTDLGSNIETVTHVISRRQPAASS